MQHNTAVQNTIQNNEEAEFIARMVHITVLFERIANQTFSVLSAETLRTVMEEADALSDAAENMLRMHEKRAFAIEAVRAWRRVCEESREADRQADEATSEASCQAKALSVRAADLYERREEAEEEARIACELAGITFAQSLGE